MPDLRIWSQNEISKLKSDLDRLFDDLCSDFDLPTKPSHLAVGPLFRKEGALLVSQFEIPEGMDRDSIRVDVTERTLSVEGRVEIKSGAKYVRRMFKKELRLPCRILPDQVKATFKDGVLEVSMPRCRVDDERTVRIEKK